VDLGHFKMDGVEITKPTMIPAAKRSRLLFRMDRLSALCLRTAASMV
jgi:hypothetical protein